MIEDNQNNDNNPIIKVLGILVLVMLVVIVGATVYGLGTGSRQRALARGDNQAIEGSNIFDLGQIRTKTADPKPSLVAAYISFPYPAAEISFKEEIGKKAPALRAAAVTYFSGKKAEELHPAYEGAVKAGLRDAFNRLLSLGSLKEIWLADFAVLQ